MIPDTNFFPPFFFLLFPGSELDLKSLEQSRQEQGKIFERLRKGVIDIGFEMRNGELEGQSQKQKIGAYVPSK